MNPPMVATPTMAATSGRLIFPSRLSIKLSSPLEFAVRRPAPSCSLFSVRHPNPARNDSATVYYKPKYFNGCQDRAMYMGIDIGTSAVKAAVVDETRSEE